jgi:hypothetical protein
MIVVGQTKAVNTTPVLITGTGASQTVLVANQARSGFSIQNVGTTAMLICFGATCSATQFHYALKGGSANNDGLGGSITFTAGTVYTDIITSFGASTAILAVMELSPSGT